MLRTAAVILWKDLRIEMRTRGGTVCGFGPLGGGEANLTLVVPTAEAARIAGRAGDFLEERVGERFPDLAERLAGAERESVVRTVVTLLAVVEYVSVPFRMLSVMSVRVRLS